MNGRITREIKTLAKLIYFDDSYTDKATYKQLVKELKRKYKTVHKEDYGKRNKIM